MLVQYQALNKSGRIVNDSILVDKFGDVYTELTKRGLTPINVKEKTEGETDTGKTDLKSLLNKITTGGNSVDPQKAAIKHLPFFTSQLAILLETGTTVANSLIAIEKQLHDPHWKQLVSEMRRHVEEGGTLASAAEIYPHIFDSVYVSMIAAGEATGNLSEILNRLAEMSRLNDRIRHKIISAMIYPALLTFIAVSVLFVITFFVLPRFSDIFTEMNVNLPASTKTLLTISEFTRQNLWLTVLIAGGIITGIVFWLRSHAGRRFTARISLKAPIFGPLISSLMNARIFRLLGLLIESSVPLLEALKLTIQSSRHYLYKELFGKIHDNVINGGSIHEIMINSNLFPPSITQMIQTGEENAQVGKVMTMLADYLDDRNETQISTLTSIMEPIILIVMGTLVGILVISMVLPMFDLAQISGG